jgi:hypothetical protein
MSYRSHRDKHTLHRGGVAFVGGSSQWSATAFPHTNQTYDIASDRAPKEAIRPQGTATPLNR